MGTLPIHTCFHCGKTNPEQDFCGSCGSPLSLDEFITARVKAQLPHEIRHRDVLETESSIKVFTKAWGWMKLIVGVAAFLVVVTGVNLFWKFSDLSKNLEEAKKAVTESAKQSKEQIARDAESAKTEIAARSAESIKQSESLKSTALQSKSEVLKTTEGFKTDLAASRKQLEAANQLQPEMQQMRNKLVQTTDELQKQQNLLSSSQSFAKQVFSSHRVEYFDFSPTSHTAAIIPPLPGGNRTVVLKLLGNTPIRNTLQLQYYVFAQPPDSFFVIAHNLVIFFWSDPPENLKQKPLTASYFPDTDDKDLIQSLTEHDGRWWADDQPLPKFNQPDLDFPGNKWMQRVPPPTKP